MKMEKVKENLIKGLNAVHKLAKENLGFILALFLLNFTTMAWSLCLEDKLDVMISYGFSLFFAVFAVTAALQALYKPILKKFAKAFLLLVTGSVFIIEFFAMYNYNILIGVGIINSILETNYNEAVEFISMYIRWEEAVGVISLILIFLHLKKHHLDKIKIGDAWFRWSVVCVLAVSMFYTVRTGIVYKDFIFDDKLLPVQRAYASAQVAFKNIEAYHDLAEKMNKEIVLTENKSKIKNVVFILGESTNRNHMGLYGYNLPTTPNLQKLKDKGEIFACSNVISPHSTTVAVLSKLFTFCDYESDQEWYEYNNLIDVMNQAGYKTFWLSNQETSGIWGNVAQLFAHHSKKYEFTRVRDSREDYGTLDEELLPLIDKAMQERADKNFFVIHLMGAHGAYYNRYPYAFAKFSEKDIKMEIDDAKKLVVAQYDNAVYYNDHVVQEIINRFAGDETLVVYISDHGEAVYDENGFAGHIEENPTRHMIEVPLLFWGSEKFKANYPEKMLEIQNSVNRPYMSDDMIHTILDLTDIKTPEYDPAKSIVNGAFDASRKRIFKERDYDQEILNDGK